MKKSVPSFFVDFNIQCPRDKKIELAWKQYNNTKVCLLVQGFTCVRHKSFSFCCTAYIYCTLTVFVFVWASVCVCVFAIAEKHSNDLYDFIVYLFFLLLRSIQLTSKPKNRFNEDSEFSHWNRSKRFYRHGVQNKNTCPIFMRVDFPIYYCYYCCCGHKIKVASF